MARGFPLGSRDHDEEADGPGEDAVCQQGQLNPVQGLHQADRQEDLTVLALHRIDQDGAFRFPVDEALGLQRAFQGGLVSPPLDLHQLITLKQTSLFRHAVRQDLPDDDLPVLHPPGTLVIRSRIDPLVEGEGPQSQRQAGETDPQQTPSDAFQVGIHGAFVKECPDGADLAE